ncbi:MAG TPA: type I restriction endonuclease subunit R [Capsulimonadaceae bacterium]|jgi:type I restriction enzyme R subunit
MSAFTESIVEEAALGWLQDVGYSCEVVDSERSAYNEVLLKARLRSALVRLNPTLPQDAHDEAFRQIAYPESASTLENNRRFHKMLVEGIAVSFQQDGATKHDIVKVVDFANVADNEFLAINQFTIFERSNRRPDILLFVNGLPLAIIELKNLADANATVKGAWNQLQKYKSEIPTLFAYNEIMVASDGGTALAGTITADWERFQPWKSLNDQPSPPGMSALEVLIRGMLDPKILLDLIRFFVVYETDGAQVDKKIAAYHQYHAVNKAIDQTIRASSPAGNGRIGVIWHTQGSGKSLSMTFFAGKIIQAAELANPTLVVITDRNDLDNQLFATFARCQELLRQSPIQAEDRASLRTVLRRASGGVVFTTIQKFSPLEDDDGCLSDRRNIIVIADEAHRSQYGFDAKVSKTDAEITYGFAKYLRDALPNASFIGFTGTPVELSDRNTKAVFGDYIDIYDIQQAVDDGATVRIYYEGRLAKITLNEVEKPKIDPEFEEITETEEQTTKDKLKRKWAQVEAMVGTDKRIALIAADLVKHFEDRQAGMDGKAMVVCMSRRICASLYNAIIKIRPDWHDADDAAGAIKVVYTGSAADEADISQHVRGKAAQDAIALRFKKPADPLNIVIVRDMWLTGFDVPCLHTMYIDKPMQGHGLMQAIARVNRVFKDKPGGLIVDYIGLADKLKEALAAYTSKDRENAGVPQEQAAEVFLEKLGIVNDLMHGFNDQPFWIGTAPERLNCLLGAQDFVLTLDDGKKRYIDAVATLGRAFALAVPHEATLSARDRVGFYQAVKAGLSKTLVDGETSPEDINAAVRQIVSKSVSSDEVVDIFTVAGLDRPELSILSDEFLQEVQGMKFKNLAVEALKKLLSDQIKVSARTNVVQSKLFSEMLQATILKLQNRSLETAQIIAELVALAKQMREANSRGTQLGLTDDELAFYDALEVNDSAVMILGDAQLKVIAKEILQRVRASVSIDWNVRDSARAALRIVVKQVLKRHGYPPDKQPQAVETVLLQTELLCAKWL